MLHTGTTSNFTYDDELLTELALAVNAAYNVTRDKDMAIAVLRSYTDVKIAQYHQSMDWSVVTTGDDPES